MPLQKSSINLPTNGNQTIEQPRVQKEKLKHNIKDVNYLKVYILYNIFSFN